MSERFAISVHFIIFSTGTTIVRHGPPLGRSTRIHLVAIENSALLDLFVADRFLSNINRKHTKDWPPAESTAGRASAGFAIGADTLGFRMMAVLFENVG